MFTKTEPPLLRRFFAHHLLWLLKALGGYAGRDRRVPGTHASAALDTGNLFLLLIICFLEKTKKQRMVWKNGDGGMLTGAVVGVLVVTFVCLDTILLVWHTLWWFYLYCMYTGLAVVCPHDNGFEWVCIESPCLWEKHGTIGSWADIITNQQEPQNSPGF